ALRTGAVVAFPAPGAAVGAAVVTIARIIKSGLHPITKSEWTFQFDAFAKASSERRSICKGVDHRMEMLEMGKRGNGKVNLRLTLSPFPFNLFPSFSARTG